MDPSLLKPLATPDPTMLNPQILSPPMKGPTMVVTATQTSLMICRPPMPMMVIMMGLQINLLMVMADPPIQHPTTVTSTPTMITAARLTPVTKVTPKVPSLLAKTASKRDKRAMLRTKKAPAVQLANLQVVAVFLVRMKAGKRLTIKKMTGRRG